MIKTAGGPGLVSPIDFHERRTPRFSRTTWIATAIVVAGHVGLGAALYYQRFELRTVLTPEPPPFRITFERPEVKPLEPVKSSETPPAPNTPLNDTPRPLTPTETFAAVPTEATPSTSTTLTFTEVVETPRDDSPVVEPTPTPSVIRNPSWARQPSGEQMMRAYPERAVAAGVSGSASMNCLVLPSGGVTDCNVTRETPGGYGFGRAAQDLSRHFRVNPRTVNGAAEGSRVNINLRFNLPED
ncbi:MAG: TonB family protein [Brevundimonas sp.]